MTTWQKQNAKRKGSCLASRRPGGRRISSKQKAANYIANELVSTRLRLMQVYREFAEEESQFEKVEAAWQIDRHRFTANAAPQRIQGCERS